MSVGNNPVEILFDEFENIVLIEGRNLDEDNEEDSNGAGKSLICEAIIFAIFGKTIRGQLTDNLINRKTKKGLHVELEFDQYKIIRKRKPNLLEFHSEDKGDETLSTMPLTQSLIEDKIGINYQTLINILCFGQHNMFNFLSANTATKRSIVENLLSLEDYNRYESIARKNLNSLKKDSAKLSGKYENMVENLEKKKDQLVSYQDKFKGQKKQLTSEIKDIESKMKKMSSINVDEELAKWEEIEERNKNLRKINEKYENTIHSLDKAKSSLDDYESKLSSFQKKIKREIKDLQEKFDELKNVDVDSHLKEWEEFDKSISQISEVQENINNATEECNKLEKSLIPIVNEIKKIDEDISKINSLELGVRCPTCMQMIDPDNSENTKKELESQKNKLFKKIDDPKTSLEELIAEKKKFKKEYKKLKEINKPSIEKEKLIRNRSDMEHVSSQIEEKSGKLDENPYADIIDNLNSEFKELEKEVKKVESELKNEKSSFDKYRKVNEPSVEKDELISYRAQKDHIEQSLEEKKKQLEQNSYEDMIKDLKSEIESTENDIEPLKNEIDKKEELIPYLEFWIKGFGNEGIKSYIINQIVPLLNSQCNYWLQFLYNNRLEITFDKYLEAEIKTFREDLFDYKGSSGGEKKRVDLAILLSFAHIMRLNSRADNNIMFLDESTESLDNSGLEGMYQTIKELSKERRIFLITHNPLLKEKFANCQKLIVTKEDDESRIEIA